MDKRVTKARGAKTDTPIEAAAPVTDAEARAAFDVMKAYRNGEPGADYEAAQKALATFNRYVAEAKKTPQQRTFRSRSSRP
jgi:hypothetical protein